jgi:cyclase
VRRSAWSNDGTKNGFANEALLNFRNWLIFYHAGGAGNIQHFVDSFLVGKADALASVFILKKLKSKH